MFHVRIEMIAFEFRILFGPNSMHLNKLIETSFLLRLTFKTIQYIEFIRNLKEKSYTNYKQFKKVSVPSK